MRQSAMQVARAQSEVRGETAHVYTDIRYEPRRTWDHERRVVIKAEESSALRGPRSRGTTRGSW